MTTPVPAHAALFVTCIIDQLYPQVGGSVVRALRRRGVSVAFPAGQTCCGQPLYNAGYTAPARRVLDAFADAECIVVPSGSCAAMMRVFYLDLFADDPVLLAKAQSLAGRTWELSELLAQIDGLPDDGEADSSDSGADYVAVTAAYHPSCHLLRELGVREAPRRLLAAVPGLAVADLPNAEQCCGFGGAFAVKYPHISEQMLADKLDAIAASGADTITAGDMGCLMHIEGALRRRNLPIPAFSPLVSGRRVLGGLVRQTGRRPGAGSGNRAGGRRLRQSPPARHGRSQR